MANYNTLLRDPRWQKKRLEILQRDNFTCQHCKDTETELHVHHWSYYGNPWDAPNEQLTTLCKYCHAIEEAVKDAPGIPDQFFGHGKLRYQDGFMRIRNYGTSGYVLFYFNGEDNSYTGMEFLAANTVNDIIEFHHNQLSNG